MKTIKCNNYTNVLRAEYRRLRKNPAQINKLRDMEQLLAKIEKLSSPEKEFAFVDGVLALAQLPSIAA